MSSLRHIIALSMLPALVFSARAPASAPQPTAEAALVRTLVRSGASERELALIRRNPSAYIPALGERLAVARVAGGEREVREATRAAAVLIEAGGDAGRVLLTDREAVLHSRARQLEVELRNPAARDKTGKQTQILQRQERNRLLRAESAIVQQLAAAGDARLRDVLLARFAQSNYTTQLQSLEYFAATSPGDPKVRGFLRPMYESKDSRFYRSPKLQPLIVEPAKGGSQP